MSEQNTPTLSDKPHNTIGWVSIDEKMPEEGEYLCYLDRGLKPGEIKIGDPPFFGHFHIFKYYTTPKSLGHKVPSWMANGWAGDISKYITHWMPLPDKP